MTREVLYCVVFILIQSLEIKAKHCNDYSSILISEDGMDSIECMSNMNFSCSSLDFVLQNIAGTPECTKIHIYNDQILGIAGLITGKAGIVIEGMDDDLLVSITCSGDQAGLVFSNSSGIELINIEWKNCGCFHQGVSEATWAAVHILYSGEINIFHNIFYSSSNVGLAMSNVWGNVSISDCVFQNFQKSWPVVGMIIRLNTKEASFSQYVITDCVFWGNDNLWDSVSVSDSTMQYQYTSNNNTILSEALGGGLNIDVGQKTRNITIEIKNCKFCDNQAWIGGGAYINIHSLSFGDVLEMHNNSFESNIAGSLGGGLYIGVKGDMIIPDTLQFCINISESVFTGNSAPHAGALAYQTIGQRSNTTVAEITIQSVTFKYNVANSSGAAIGVFKWEAGLGGVTPTITLLHCSVSNNYFYNNYFSTSTILGSGTIYTQGISIAFRGLTIIKQNYGTAILASTVSIFLSDNVVISENLGVRGGAVNLIGGSRMVIQKGLNLTFRDNCAELFGGAIYHVFPVMGVVGQNKYCVFQYYDSSITDPEKWDANIWFINNTALASGLSFYLSSADSCYRNQNDYIFTEMSTYHFFPNYTNQIATPPVMISFKSSSITCLGEDNCWAELMLGEKLTLLVDAVDSFNNSVRGFAVVNIACLSENNTLIADDLCDYELGGINLIEFNEKPQQVAFHIEGDSNSTYSNHLILIWQLIEVPASRGYLHIRIKQCYLGYVYDEEKRMCACFDAAEDLIACNTTDYTACVQFGYWYGMLTIQGRKEFTVVNCPFGHCDYTADGQCPTSQCGADGSAYQFFCKLPQEDSDELCLHNRGGSVCSDCRENYSFTFDFIQCIDNGHCHKAYFAVLILLNVVFLLLITAFILLVAKYNLRIGSGKLYCLVFYFSVLQYFVGGIFPSNFLYSLEVVFTGFIQLNPKIYGLLPICSGIYISKPVSTLLNYLNPLFLATVIIIISFVSWKWPRFALFPNSSISINAICIMLYILFISVTQTSLKLLTPANYPGVKGVFTEIDRTMPFFSVAYLPYVLIALIIQIITVIPFLGLLLLSPFLIRFNKLNLTRLKPILDEYQACYKDQYRFFAGYYLTCRQLIFLISFLNLGVFSYIYILQILSIVLLTIHCLVQPYKNKYLNVLDGLLILDLVFLSILHGNTANFVFDDVIALKIVLIYFLILLPVIYLICLCVYPAISVCWSKIKKHSNNKSTHTSHGNSRAAVKTSVVHLTPDITVTDYTEVNHQNDDVVLVEHIEREPLLFQDSLSSIDYESAAVNVDQDDLDPLDSCKIKYTQAKKSPSRSVLEMTDTTSGFVFQEQ